MRSTIRTVLLRCYLCWQFVRVNIIPVLNRAKYVKAPVLSVLSYRFHFLLFMIIAVRQNTRASARLCVLHVQENIIASIFNHLFTYRREQYVQNNRHRPDPAAEYA